MDQGQQRQQSNCVKFCTCAITGLGYIILGLGSIILCPFVLVGGLLFSILFVGPLIYYRGTILNSDALANKYSNEGVRLQGTVIKRWKSTGHHSTTMLHVSVVYPVDRERYVINDLAVDEEFYSLPNIDLIRLPDYARSAISFVGFDGVDPDFPTSSKLQSIFFGFFWMLIWNGIPLGIVLSLIDACDYCTNLFAPIFCGMIALELYIGYWAATYQRSLNLKSTLYRAKRVRRPNPSPANDATPNHLSYSSFFEEDKHSCFSVISNIFLDFITAVAWIGVAIYFVIFGGGFVIMYSVVVRRRRDRLLECYKSNGIEEVGTVLCRQGHTKGILVVQYTVDEQMYKKQLAVPFHMVRNGFVHHTEYEAVSDDPDLLYINANPYSATLKCQIDNPQHENKRFRKKVWWGLCIMTIQVFFITLLIGAASMLDRAQSFFLLAGIVCSGEVVFGLLGACIHQKFFYERELLWGAQRVFPISKDSM